MCLFVSATLPAEADVAALKAHVPKTFAFVPVVNPSLVPQLRPDEREYSLCTGHCHCDTSLGTGRRREDRQALHDEQALRKYRAKGWSEAKISRALEQSRSAVHRGPDHDELQTWEQMIRAALEKQRIPYIGLLLHQYRKSEHDEEITLRRTETIPLAHLGEEALLSLERDVLYRFTAR